jgi:dTDP-glucose 4,6-dehydratase
VILVTGGAGFLGSAFVLDWLARTGESVVDLDLLTYAGDRSNLAALDTDARHVFVHGDVCDRRLLDRLLADHQPRAVVHCAAESHVDRSIAAPGQFVRTNVQGTFVLLEAVRAYWSTLTKSERLDFRFLHVSTDEVYGSLTDDDMPADESHRYAPNSPYSASKAGADHLVRAWHRTYGLPVLVTHGSNSYGPRQLPEKLIPRTVVHALRGQSIPLYGDGCNRRDWLYANDHCAALRAVLEHGRPGTDYNVAGGQERTNIEVVRSICRLLDELHPDPHGPHERLIAFVADRLGHDRRYAMNTSRIAAHTGWRPSVPFHEGLRTTVRWYLEHPDWVERMLLRSIHQSLATQRPTR